MPVLTHLRPVPPTVAQLGKLAAVPLPDAVGLPKPADERVEVPALGIEVHSCPVGRPVVLGGEKVRQRLQPPVKVRVVPALRRAPDRMAELLTGIVFDGQYPVDVAGQSQRADHVVRRPDQVVPAQRFEPFVLLACHPGSLVQIRAEPCAVELADDLGAAELFLVPVDLVAPRQPEYPECQLPFAYFQAITHDLAEEAVERVLTRDVSDILPVH